MGRAICFIGSRKILETLDDMLKTHGYQTNSYTGNNKAIVQDENGDKTTMQDKKIEEFKHLIETSSKYNIILYS